jgi:hypothetical protein
MKTFLAGPNAMSRMRVLLIATCIIAATSNLSAEITLVSRLSDAQASADGGCGVSETPPPQVQTDFLPAHLTNTASSHTIPCSASGSASSNSSIVANNQTDTLQITGEGDAHAFVYRANSAHGSAKLITISFTLDGNYLYSLGGQLSSDPYGAYSVAFARLFGPGLNEQFFAYNPPAVTFSKSGTLGPGNYTLNVEIDAHAGNYSFTGDTVRDGRSPAIPQQPVHSESGAQFSFALGHPGEVQLFFSPPDYGFAPLTVGQASTKAFFLSGCFQAPYCEPTVSVKNSGTADFSIVSNGCTTLPMGGFCEVDVAFNPQTVGPTEANLQATVSGSTATASLRGTGLSNPSQATNLSTRMIVQPGDDVAIAGFIISGGGAGHFLIRGMGPSLANYGIQNPLANPTLELHGPNGFTTITNNDWRDTQEGAVIATGRPPGNDLESAIVVDLLPGAYTAILAGNAGTTGVGLVEIYDLSPAQGFKPSNISTRANVRTGDDIVIAGFILGAGGGGENAIIIRGLGPSLSAFGLDALPDPKLELRNSDGALIASDDNWMDDPNQAAIIQAAGLAPGNSLESALATTLMPGTYTALLSGVNNGTGTGLVEVYDRGATGN